VEQRIIADLKESLFSQGCSAPRCIMAELVKRQRLTSRTSVGLSDRALVLPRAEPLAAPLCRCNNTRSSHMLVEIAITVPKDQERGLRMATIGKERSTVCKCGRSESSVG
jgi:hypothetical protein